MPAPSVRRPFAASLVLLVATMLGCQAEHDEDSTDVTASADAGVDALDAADGVETDAAPGTDVDEAAAAELYATLCASCHGDRGQGGVGPQLAGTTRERTDLVVLIDETMPTGAPERCDRACAETLANYILGLEDPDAPLDCTTTETSPRAMRLLTRREYAATVRDLFGSTAASCGDSTECDVRAEACSDGLCQSLDCGEVAFVHDPGGERWDRVVVASDATGWNVDAGWPLGFDDASGLWWAHRSLDDGEYRYKFVLIRGSEQRWVTDPGADGFEPDGFGGQNGVLRLDCDGPAAPSAQGPDLPADLPPEVRPQGFGFETSAVAGVVTSNHVEAYLANADAIGQYALARWDELVPCGRSGGADCAETFVRDFGRRAFRRPLTDAQVGRYVELVEGADTFEEGIRRAVEAFASSPYFLYRMELGEDTGDGTYRLTQHEIASALSYLYWGTMPDAELLAAADRGELGSNAQIEAQARRLLADARARESVATFAEQWLGIEPVMTMTRNPELFPDFGDPLRVAMREETRRLVTHVVFDGTGRFGELFEANYTYVNALLARIYEIEGVSGDQLRTVHYDDPRRAGILGHASVLASTAHSDQTSPIRRGLFVRQRLLCQEFGLPPAEAGGVPEVDPDATTRERFRQHTDNPVCYACHQYIDDLGFGFEHFDSVGAWRETENGAPIDALGNMNDIEGMGTDTDGFYASLPELAAQIAEADSARACFVRQYYRYARGYLDGADDRCTIAELDQAFVSADLDIIELMVATVLHPSFTVRR